jgi:hypothetical protein
MQALLMKKNTQINTLKLAGLSGSAIRTAVTTRVGEGKRPLEIECRIGLIENNACWCGDCWREQGEIREEQVQS